MADEPSIVERISALSAPEPAPAAEPDESPDDGDEGTERAEATSETETEDKASAEDSDAKSGADDADTDDEGIEISDLEGLAEYIGADVGTLYENLAVPVTVNGKRVDVRLGEIKDSYVAVAEAKRIQSEAKALRDEVAQQRQANTTAIQQQAAESAAMLKAMEEQALSPFNAIPWEQLRADDPSEWSAKRRELDETKERLNSVRTQVRQHYEKLHSDYSEKMKTAESERLAKEREALYSAWPEMADESKGVAETARLRNELVRRGFSEQEIDGATDHRIVLMARDAMRYRETASKADVAKKKVVKIAKHVLKPGAKQGKAEQQENRHAELQARLRKSGHVNDAAELIAARLKG